MARLLSHSESIQVIGSYSTISALKAVDVTALPNHIWANVDVYGEYYYDKFSNKSETLPEIVIPDDVIGSGRWIRKVNAAASTYNIVSLLAGLQVSGGDLLTQLNNKLNLSGGTLSGSLTLSADPSNPLHAATKHYVDSIVQGLDVKASVRVATTGNITLSGTQTIDSVVLIEDDRLLVKNQTVGAENGIYVVKTGTWIRAVNFDEWSKIPGGFTFVEEGATHNASGWVCISDSSGTLDTTPIIFALFSSAGSYSADGLGIVLSGSQFKIELADSTLSKSGSGLKVAAGGITNTEVSSFANIARNKLALGTPNQILMNDVSGAISSTPALQRTQISAGTPDHIVINDGTGNLASVSAIQRTQVATGTANHIVINDGSGNLSSVSAIQRTQIAIGTANHIVINDGSGNLSSVPAIQRNQIATGTANHIVTNDSAGNLSSVSAIQRNQIATGTANHVVVNDGSGNLSGVTSLDVARGGTGLTSLGSSNQMIGMNNAGTGYEYKTVAFTNGNISNGTNSLTFSIPQSVATSATPTFAGLVLNGTGGLQLPSGDTSQRPASPVNGTIRYNSSNQKLEAYENGTWVNIVGSGGSSGTSSVDYSFHFAIPGVLDNGDVANIGTNGTAFTTPMGFAIPVTMNIIEIAIDFGTYNAIAAGYLQISVRELNTGGGVGVGNALTSSAGTEKYLNHLTTSGSLSTTYHKTIVVTGLSGIQLTAGNILFVAVTGVNYINATDMSMVIRCKQ